jgi:ABC-2 type transport system ATP-binding protein
VLFLDEPTTGLDPRSRLGMLEFIADLVQDGTTILLTTQYLEEADRLADRMVVIDKGEVIARGTADELKAQVGGERLELTVSSVEELRIAAEALRPLAQADEQSDEQTRRLSLPVTGGTDTLAEALRRLSGIPVGVLDIGLRRPDLDDVFLTLTGHVARDASAGQPDEASTALSAGASR